jgi:hypothetical protein
MDDVVLDDLIEPRPGDQVVADGIVRASDAFEVDDSLLTGELQPVHKAGGDSLLAGSFVAAGSGRYQATAVGDDANAHRLVVEARRFSLVRSELMEGVNRILRYITWAIVPVAILTTLNQLHANDSVAVALSGTVAALVGMVPQGLVLLTSIAFAVAAVGLARHQVLVQQLPAIKGLARVDVVCFDKTGTLADGTLTFDHGVRVAPNAQIEEALGSLGQAGDASETLAVIARRFPAAPWIGGRRIAFSSARKWSGVDFAEHGAWVLGAHETFVGNHRQPLRGQLGWRLPATASWHWPEARLRWTVTNCQSTSNPWHWLSRANTFARKQSSRSSTFRVRVSHRKSSPATAPSPSGLSPDESGSPMPTGRSMPETCQTTPPPWPRRWRSTPSSVGWHPTRNRRWLLPSRHVGTRLP